MRGGATRPEAASAAITRLLDARSVAIFGASANPTKLGHMVVRELVAQRFAGRIVLVNPGGGSTLGLPLEQPGAASGCDVAVLATPPAVCPGLVGECARLGIGAVVVSCDAPAAGRAALARALRHEADRTGVRVLGANSIGVFRPATGLNLTTLRDLPAGDVAFLSQSGGLMQHVGRRLAQLGSGFRVAVSLGDRADIGFAETLTELREDRGVRAVLLYLESLDERDALFDELEATTAHLPVVAMLGGTSNPGAAASRSHTGSMLPPHERARGLLEDCGVTVATALSIAIAIAAARHRLTDVKSAFVVSDGGGAAVLATDALTTAAVALPSPSQALSRVLAETLGLTEEAMNPLEFAGRAERDLDIYLEALRPILASDEYDAVIVAGILGGYLPLNGEHLRLPEIRLAEGLADLARRHPGQLAVQSPFVTDDTPPIRALRAAGVPCLEWPEEVAAAVARRAGDLTTPRTVRVSAGAGPAEASQSAQTEALVVLALDRAGVPHALGLLVDEESLGVVASGRWVLRLSTLVHKRRSGGVLLDLGPADLPNGYRRLVRLAAILDVEPAVRLAPYHELQRELLITLWRNGPGTEGLMVGSGGTGAERANDFAVGRVTADTSRVRGLLSRTAAGRALLEEAPEHVDDLLITIRGLRTALETELRWAAELEVNPLALTSRGWCVLDALASPADAEVVHA